MFYAEFMFMSVSIFISISELANLKGSLARRSIPCVAMVLSIWCVGMFYQILLIVYTAVLFVEC